MILRRPITAATLYLLCALCPPVVAGSLASFTVVERLPHHGNGFTQGLELHDNVLFESSGLYGKSWIARSRFPAPVKTEVTRRRLPRQLFAEGLTVLNDKLYLLSWRSERGLIFDADSLDPAGEFQYAGEGWGLTNNGNQLIMSDGSGTLRFIDPASFETIRELIVHFRGEPVNRLNELEYYQGHIVANHWGADHLLVIDENSGEIRKIVQLQSLYPATERGKAADVMNGIAYDAGSDTWLITGKRWPWIYRLTIDLTMPSDPPTDTSKPIK